MPHQQVNAAQFVFIAVAHGVMQPAAHVLGLVGQLVGIEHPPERIFRVHGGVGTATDALAYRGVLDDGFRDLCAQLVVRTVQASGTQREHQQSQGPAQGRHREVDDRLAHGALEIPEAGFQAPFHQRPLVIRVTFFMPLLDHGGGVVKLHQAVGHAP